MVLHFISLSFIPIDFIASTVRGLYKVKYKESVINKPINMISLLPYVIRIDCNMFSLLRF